VIRMSSSSEYAISAHPRYEVERVEMLRDLLADLRRGCGHDVEVPGVGREEVAGAFDLDEDRDAVRAVRRDGELRLHPEPVTRHVALHLPGDGGDRVGDHVVRDEPGVVRPGDLAEDRVAHDERWFGRVEHDDRLASGRAPADLDGPARRAGELVDVGACAGT